MADDGPSSFELDGPDALERRLIAVAGVRREAGRVRARIAEVEAELEALDREVTEALERVDEEEADVDRLRGFSFAAVLPVLRDRREAELQREIAEAAEARLAVVTLRERQAAEAVELSALQDRLVALGDPDVEWEQALEDRERWVREQDHEAAERLAEIAAQIGDLEDEKHECDEAREVANEALSRLDRVAEALGTAEDWNGFDTWFGGGVLTGSDRYDRLDDARECIGEAEDSLRRLGRELGEIGEEVESTITVERWDRAFDVFFRDVFADASMRRRIADAAALVDHAQERVGRIAADVEERSRNLAARVEALQDERAEILTARNSKM